MRVAVMQPYFFPYIGYFQLLNAVDIFVVYDDIQFSKKGWIQRNRFLLNGQDELFSIPLKKDSDYLNINERELALDYQKINLKTFRKIIEAYKKAPFFDQTIQLIENCLVLNLNTNLFEFIYHSIIQIKGLLEIKSKIVTSSSLGSDLKKMKGEERVIATCERLGSNIYINAIGGQKLYAKDRFLAKGIELKFIQSNQIIYKQFENEFVPNLSILDALMFNSISDVKLFLNQYKLI